MSEKSFPTLTEEQENSGLKKYVGTKGIAAVQGKHKTTGEDGWIVVYPDGYESFSPAHAFEEAYRPVDAMPFEAAIWAIKQGYKVLRPTQKNPPVFYLAKSPYGAVILRSYDGRAHEATFSQTDMNANDWQIVEE